VVQILTCLAKIFTGPGGPTTKKLNYINELFKIVIVYIVFDACNLKVMTPNFTILDSRLDATAKMSSLTNIN